MTDPDRRPHDESREVKVRFGGDDDYIPDDGRPVGDRDPKEEQK